MEFFRYIYLRSNHSRVYAHACASQSSIAAIKPPSHNAMLSIHSTAASERALFHRRHLFLRHRCRVTPLILVLRSCLCDCGNILCACARVIVPICRLAERVNQPLCHIATCIVVCFNSIASIVDRKAQAAQSANPGARERFSSERRSLPQY